MNWMRRRSISGVRWRRLRRCFTSPSLVRARRIMLACNSTFNQRSIGLRRCRMSTKRREFREKLKGYVNLYSFMSQIMPWCDPALEMLYSFGRFLLPHLPLDRDAERVRIGDEVGLQYYRLRTYLFRRD